MENSEWITLKEACDIIVCPISAIYRYKRAGRLRFQKLDGQREHSYNRSDVLEVKKFRYHPDKHRLAAKSRKSIRIKMLDEAPDPDMPRMIRAVCPRCGRAHKISKRWIGTGTPRFFCPVCREVSYRWSSSYQNQAMPAEELSAP